MKILSPAFSKRTCLVNCLQTTTRVCVCMRAGAFMCTGGIIHLLLITFIIIHVSFPSSYENVPNSLEFIEQGHVYTHIIIYAEYIIYSYGQAMPYRLHFFIFRLFVCSLVSLFICMCSYLFVIFLILPGGNGYKHKHTHTPSSAMTITTMTRGSWQAYMLFTICALNLCNQK